jgi:hypothetical protein
MFKITAAPLVWWPVTVPGVSEEGEVVENRFEMRFRILTEDEHQAFILSVGANEKLDVANGTVSAPSEEAAKVVLRIAADWRGVGAENGEPLKFSDEHLRQLLNVPNAFNGVMKAYGACRAGRAEVRAGN